MQLTEAIGVAGLSTAVAFVTLPIVIRVLRRTAILDTPSARSSHDVPTVRGGGLGVVAGIAVSVAAVGITRWGDGRLGLLLGAIVLLGAVGFVDDLRSLPVRTRLAAQVVLALGAATVALGGTGLDGAVVAAAMALGAGWIIGFVNVFNFMDGINGISAATAVVSGSSFAASGLWLDAPRPTALGAAVAGACLAFLPFNLPTARSFLGDVGSYAIGATLAICAMTLLIAGAGLLESVAPLLLYLGDAGTTLLRRIRAGERWWEPHRDHAYQRLANGGWGHARVTVLVAVVTAGLAGAGLIAGRFPSPSVQVAAWAFCGAVVAAFVRLPNRPRVLT